MNRRSFIETVTAVMASVVTGFKGLFAKPDQTALVPSKVDMPRRPYRRYVLRASKTFENSTFEVLDFFPRYAGDAFLEAKHLLNAMHFALRSNLPQEPTRREPLLWDFSLGVYTEDTLTFPRKLPASLKPDVVVNFFGLTRLEMVDACYHDKVFYALVAIAAGTIEKDVGGINFFQLPQWSKLPWVTGKHIFAPMRAIQHLLPHSRFRANPTVLDETP